jgi:cytochrome c peroxidase
MSRTVLYALLIAIGVVVIALRQDHYTERMEAAHSLVRTTTDNAVQAFTRFQTTVATQNAEAMRAAFTTARFAYKRAEVFLEYTDPFAVWMTVNGAPLPKTDPQSTFLDIINPVGFQPLEELLWEDSLDMLLIDTLSRGLAGELNRLCTFASSVRYTDRHLLEAARTSIIRMATLSISGFDTPSSGNALAETEQECITLRAIIELYAPELSSRDRALLQQLTLHLDRISNQLRPNGVAADFDSFDRLTFIREVLDPLFGLLVDVQGALGAEFRDEVSSVRSTVQPRSRHLFASTLLDAHYYTAIPRSLEGPLLVDLGRMLFFDPVLSDNGERACASCHLPELGFTDGAATSLAIGKDARISRNAMTVLNAVFADRYFYDLRADRLEDVVEHVVTNDLEFHSSMATVASVLNQSTEYRALFQQAFHRSPGSDIQTTDVQHALAAYIASLTSFNTNVDRYARGESVTLPADVKRGFNLFHGKAACATCHFPPTYAGLVPPMFTDSESEILGVPSAPAISNAVIDPDPGRYGKRVKEVAPFHMFSFKTPTVRNIALTAPYMHHGAYSTLEQVVEFYNVGGGKNIGIDLEYQTLPFDNLQLTAQEQADLISFMQALTDTVGLTQRPTRLPAFPSPSVNARVIGGLY